MYGYTYTNQEQVVSNYKQGFLYYNDIGTDYYIDAAASNFINFALGTPAALTASYTDMGTAFFTSDTGVNAVWTITS
jgi:hypothetical protein